MSNKMKQFYAAKYPFVPQHVAQTSWEHDRFIIEQLLYKELVEAIPKIQTLSEQLSLTPYMRVLKSKTLPYLLSDKEMSTPSAESMNTYHHASGYWTVGDNLILMINI